MEKFIIFQGITVDQLLSQIESIVKAKLDEKLAELKPGKSITYLVAYQKVF